MSKNTVRACESILCGLLAVSVIGSAPAMAATYAVTELPRLNSDPNLAAVPLSINNLGWVSGMAPVPVTYLYIFTFNLPRAYLWKNGTVTNLGLLPGSGTLGISAARCINDANYVVGINTGTPPDFGGDDEHNHAFLWPASGNLIDLGSMTGSASDLSGAYSVNLGGHVVGNWAPSSDPNIQHAWLRWSNGVATQLGTLGGTQSFAWDINDNNVVVGKAQLSNGVWHAFRWQNGQMSDLGVMPGYEASSEAFAIDNSGQIVFMSASSGNVGHSFLRRSDGTTTDLGTLSGYPSTIAAAINDKGLVVGTAFDPNGQPTAFVWVAGQIYNLNTLASTSGWTLQTATSVNNAGWVVGSGIHNGLPAGYLIKLYVLSATPSPSVGGTISLSGSGPFYDPNTTVTVTANPASGYTFASWRGDLSGSTNPTTIKLTSSKAITANFAVGRYTLTLASNPSSGGTITADPLPDPNDGKYAAGTIVTLTANPATGYAFSSWSGDASGSTNPTTVTMNGARSVTANFSQLRYALTLASSPPEGGTITADPLPGGDGKYAYGTVVTLTANAATGYSFGNWSGDALGSTNPVQVTMDGNKNVTANFGQTRHTLQLTVDLPGTGTIDAVPPPDGDGKYAYGTLVTLTANPAGGYSFSSWSGGATGSTNPVQIAVNGDLAVTAHFTQMRHVLTLTATPPTGGSIVASPLPDGDGKYAYGTPVTLTANPAVGYVLSSWSGDATGSDNPVQVTMDGDKSVTATFAVGRTLSLEVMHSNYGSVSVEPNLPLYPDGCTVTLTAVPNSGKAFAGWTIFDPNYPGDSNHASVVDPNTLSDPLVLPLVMEADMHVEADFKCGSGVNQVLPLLVVGLGVCMWLTRAARRRS